MAMIKKFWRETCTFICAYAFGEEIPLLKNLPVFWQKLAL
jgi:hypothetical protein